MASKKQIPDQDQMRNICKELHKHYLY